MLNKIGQPSTGQPMDIDYLAEITRTIDSLVDAVNKDSKESTKFILKSPTGKTSTGKLIIFTDKISFTANVSNGSSYSQTLAFNYSDAGFTFTPIVSTTIESPTPPTGQIDFSSVVTSINSSGAEVSVRASGNGSSSVSIHFIAIGYSNL